MSPAAVAEPEPPRAPAKPRPRAARKLRPFPVNRRKVLWGLVLVFVAALGVGMWLRHRMTHVEENDAHVEGEVVTVASRVDGWLVTRPVIEGDRVHKGDILGELDTRDARLRLKNLQASVSAHEAQIRETTLQRDILQKTTGAQRENARAQLAAAEAAAAGVAPQLETARSDSARADELIKTNGVSRQYWEHARNALLQQEAALRQAQANVATQKASLVQATAQLDQVAQETQQIEVLKGERDALAAQAEQVRQEIDDRTLRAPGDGVVDRTFIHAGDYVQSGQWLMMLHDPADVWVEANVKETAVGRIKPGQKVRITVDAYPGLKVTGRVLRVGNAATNQFALLPSPNPSGNFTKITQRVPVRVAIDPPGRPLQPGLMVEVVIDVAD
ncbi:MAG: HlyD family secretion protein [Chthoniobacteraceae bacterium]